MLSFKLLATASLIVGSLSLGGCIASSNGSTPEDFEAQNNSAAAAQAAQQSDDTENNVQANCLDEACQELTAKKRALVTETQATVALVPSTIGEGN